MDSQNILIFKKALENNRLKLVFQPIVNINNEQIEYYETLLRIRDVNGNYIAIAPVIEEAEKEGFIEYIDLILLTKISEKLRQDSKLKLSLNVSANSLNNPEWIDKYYKYFPQELASRLVIEVTESSNNRSKSILSNFSNLIKNNGSKVALDDFTSGYSTFHELSIVKPDIVKLDGSYINQVLHNIIYQKFIKFMVDIKKDLNFKIVAEFVDSQEKLELLREIGVDYVQGYLFPTVEL